MLFLNEAIAFELDHRAYHLRGIPSPPLLVAAAEEGRLSLCRLTPRPSILRRSVPGVARSQPSLLIRRGFCWPSLVACAGLSAYHVAALGKNYPPILITTSRRDDRAHPGHARKMAAKLQAMGYEAHFYELATGGHSYGENHEDIAAFMSLSYAFLRRAIGWGSN